MKVAIIHDRVPETGADPDHMDVLVQADAVETALRALGHQADSLSFSLDIAAFMETLRRYGPDRVFNLVESVEGSGRLIHLAPSILDFLHLPYTGAEAEALYFTSNKLLAKRMLAASGIPTPPCLTLEEARHRTAPLEGAHIVKSVWEHASVGMGEDAVIASPEPDGLRRAMEDRLDGLGGECFAERYVEGREFNVSLLAAGRAPQVLPIAEIRFQDYPTGKARIVDYRAKWDPDSFEYGHTVRSFDMRESDAPLLNHLADMAVRCWDAFGLNGYARVDFRVDPENRAWVLEINANPCLSPDAGFAAAADRAGLAFHDVVARILDRARAAR